jgi:hypothetical protein
MPAGNEDEGSFCLESPVSIVANLDLNYAREGMLLEPFRDNPVTASCFQGWNAVALTAGIFFHLIEDGGWGFSEHNGKMLFEHRNIHERILNALSDQANTYSLTASLCLKEGETTKLLDGPEPGLPLNGLLLHYQHSRRYIFFGFEGRERIVVYERDHDSWTILDSQNISLPEGFVTLKADVSPDGISCCCPELKYESQIQPKLWQQGRAAIIFHGPVLMEKLTICQTDIARTEEAQRAQSIRRKMLKTGVDLPDPVLRYNFEVPGLLGGTGSSDFHTAGRYDLLLSCRDSVKAMTETGKLLWELPVSPQPWDAGSVRFSKSHYDGGRLVYFCCGKWHGDTFEPTDACVVNGRTGEIFARRTLPEASEPGRGWHFSPESGNLRGEDDFDIILRPENKSGTADIWAYDKNLNLIWQQTQPKPYYGHSEAVCFVDINRDGRDEVLAGGNFYDSNGELLWRHDLGDAMRDQYPNEHYDDVAVGFLAGPDNPPLAFLLAGNPGLYIVDPRTGKTVKQHLLGHAQDAEVGKLRADRPGEQVLVKDRWGSFGIISLFDGFGEMLWSICPDDNSHRGPNIISWPGSETQLIWLNVSPEKQYLLDGYGRLVRQLPALSSIWGKHLYRDVNLYALRLGESNYDSMYFSIKEHLYIFKPESE